MACKKPGIVFLEEWVAPARTLNREELGELMSCLFDVVYGDGVYSSANPRVDMMLTMIVPKIMEDISKYSKKCAKNKENSHKRRSYQEKEEEVCIDINPWDDPIWMQEECL